MANIRTKPKGDSRSPNPFPLCPVRPSLPCPREASLLPQSPYSSPPSTATEDRRQELGVRGHTGTRLHARQHSPRVFPHSLLLCLENGEISPTKPYKLGLDKSICNRTPQNSQHWKEFDCLSTAHLPDVFMQWKLLSREWTNHCST